MTDSVLQALLPQLNAPFDRTLLLVIADRSDEVEAGSGEGWRVLHQFDRKPDLIVSAEGTSGMWYCMGRVPPAADRTAVLPLWWYVALEQVVGRTVGSTYGLAGVDTADSYLKAAKAWLRLLEEQKQLTLEGFK